MAKVKTYNEKVEETIFSRDFGNTSEEWKFYPEKRVKCERIKYDWTYEKDWKDVNYEWEKIKISVYKLRLEDWNAVIQQKAINGRAVADGSYINMKPEEFQEFIASIK